MLWLAGLMGLVGVGAASIAVVNLQQDDDEDDDLVDQDHAPDDDTAGNLLDDISVYDTPPEDTRLSDMEEDAILYESFADDDAFLAGGAGDFDLTDDSVAADDFATNAPTMAEPPVDLGRTVEEMPLAGDWITQGDTPEVIDYDALDQQLLLVWDDMADGATPPDVALSPDPDDPDVVHVAMNGTPLAEIHGEPGLTLADITLVALSSALIAGLKPSQKRLPMPLIERD